MLGSGRGTDANGEALPVGRLRWRPIRLPLRRRFEAADPIADRETVLLSLETADGLVGWGEAAPLGSFGGGSVSDVLALLDTYGPALAAGAPGTALAGAGAAALRCALESARLDIAARRREEPLAALLAASVGGRPYSPDVEVNAVIGSAPVAETVGFAREALDAGYTTLKLKTGVESFAVDIARVHEVRAQLGRDFSLRLDANAAWSEATALAVLQAVAGEGVALVEQPIAPGNVSALRAVQRASSVPIAADESLARPAEAAEVVATRAAAVLVLKPTVVGGVGAAAALARDGAETGLRAVATATFGSSIEVALALHLASVLDGARWGGIAHGLSTAEHLAADVTGAPLVPTAGRLALPAAPGLGVVPTTEALDAVATGPWAEAT